MISRLLKKALIAGLLVLFVISVVAVPTVFAQGDLVLTVKTDKSSYVLREQVEISGNLTYQTIPVQGGLVAVEVRDPRPTPNKIVVRTLPAGTTTPPPSGWSVEVISATLCDSNGVPLQSTLRADAFFKATVRNNSPVSRLVLVTINVYDNSMIPIGTLSTQFTLGVGDVTDVRGDIDIPRWATPGISPIYANAYTDWPHDGGVPYCPEKAGNYTLRESEYESPPGNPLPTPYIQNGTYKTKLNLSPEPYPGTYMVDATAWYQGWTDTSATTFTVTDITAHPRASFVAKPPVAGPGYEVTFDGTYSSAEGYNDTIKSYSWKFGDTGTGSGSVAKHTYANIGNYTVTLNVTDNEGFWNTTEKMMRIAIVRDAAVLSIQTLSVIYDNWVVKIPVTVRNEGTMPQTFNVSLYSNKTTLIQTKQASNLGPYLSTILDFSWNTTGIVRYAHYNLTATIPPVVNETDTSDNTLTSGLIYTMALGDQNNNRQIDIFDLVSITTIYGVTNTSPRWNIMADLRPDNKIDIFDVVKLTIVYAKKY
jgi:hypothetical protein